ncbi:hypothetical protein [Bradyrhizobium sp. CCBAU 51753]|uniref:hypothetical protein n=1 Tax=Bradyrhizobium sp. CCBAU 51753 TaxID=1325100 RepID=UPI00188BB358|nr:hypothetical protein [Bradyrhizobium sp. CCBAU 51753]QOZ28574.1 hypothetical protein XH93_37195 [Bradyrhizobium sp. CCBAU 51753]
MTRGDEILSALDGAIKEIEALFLAHYTADDIRRVEDAGSCTEWFFKAAIFPDLDAKAPFDTAINRLKSIGINREVRDSIHALRELYNAAKHNPSAQIRLKVANDVLSGARKALEAIIHEGPGQVRAPVSAAVSRLLWVSGYDHYTAGCTSVYVSLPLPRDIFATHIDVFCLHFRSWEPLLSDLVASGNFYYGRDHFDDDVYARFNEDDFINAGIWDGDYRQLITILARHEHRSLKDEVIVNLRRDHLGVSVLSAIALAASDVTRSNERPLEESELARAILERADSAYAMPDERLWVRRAAEALATMIAQVPVAQWKAIEGPFWNLWNPKQLVAHVQSPDPERVPFVIDDANRIVVV